MHEDAWKGKAVTILPETKRLKQVVHDHGTLWVVLSGPYRMQCFDGRLGVFVRNKFGSHCRNVLLEHIEEREREDH